MKIGLIDVDSHNFPNLALMKIANFHKKIGDTVEWVNYLEKYEKVYVSKVFSFTPDIYSVIQANEIERGGTGYDIYKKLPEHIDCQQPDYSIYPQSICDCNTAYGFLTRGCIRNCKWCIVPSKEGTIKPYSDIEDVLQGKKSAILLDNNILSCDYGISQLYKISKMNVRVDFNQGLDARLVTQEISHILAKIKFINNTIRFSCDTSDMINTITEVKKMLKNSGFNGTIFIYVLLSEDINECLSRIMALDYLSYENCKRTRKIQLFAQPFRSFISNNKLPQWQLDMARWCNKREIFYSVNFEDYQPRKKFYCKSYFNEKL